MKRLILLVLAIILCTSLHAQVGGISFTPYISGSSSSSSYSSGSYGSSGYGDVYGNPYDTYTPPPSEVYSVTAYGMDYNENIYSIQIKVKITSGSYGSVNVIAKYNRSIGSWQDIPTKPTVYKCSSYSSNYLEQQCMYKALVGTDYVYFNM